MVGATLFPSGELVGSPIIDHARADDRRCDMVGSTGTPPITAFGQSKNEERMMVEPVAPRRGVIIESVKVKRYRAPTSGKTYATRPAAYRGEARARFAATCDCYEHGAPCRFHDLGRWEVEDAWSRSRGGVCQTYSLNGLIVARLAVVLAREDGLELPWPKGQREVVQDTAEDLPF